MDDQDVPTFGTLSMSDTAFSGQYRSNGAEASATVGVSHSPVEDELSFAASVDKVQEATEQLAEFLVKFSALEQHAILEPFLSGNVGSPGFGLRDELSCDEAHLDEARSFFSHYLDVFSDCERDLILEKWRPAFDTASIPSQTESLTPSVTPTGSITPTAVTPREFLSARREVNDMYHSHSPTGEAGR
mmetsp:Transcript_36404/g.58727  ORF Transcript_36404/g.58727 Transcript_36404/m.58727 type:complete len:188 (-) Transcript_36404:197-760(-)